MGLANPSQHECCLGPFLPEGSRGLMRTVTGISLAHPLCCAGRKSYLKIVFRDQASIFSVPTTKGQFPIVSRSSDDAPWSLKGIRGSPHCLLSKGKIMCKLLQLSCSEPQMSVSQCNNTAHAGVSAHTTTWSCYFLPNHL